MDIATSRDDLSEVGGGIAARPEPSGRAGSYREILRSSALIGGSSCINIVLGIVRVKATALILGPAGVGMMGIYGSIAELAQCVSGMGINSSGVRQIAEAAGAGQPAQIAKTAKVVKILAAGLGMTGALLLWLFAAPVAAVSFGTLDHVAQVALLPVAVFLMVLSGGYSALVQGLRRIGDLARINVISGAGGVLVSLPLIYFFRESGLVPSIVAVAALTAASSRAYSRRALPESAPVGFPRFREEAVRLLQLGFVFMASGILTLGASYLIRIMVVRQSGLEAGGFYQSAWTIGGLYIGFILQSMGADFYPRLTAVAQENAACNRLVNEQALVSLLLAGPGVMVTLTCAPVVIPLFYSARFLASVEIVRWICLGMTLRVVAWPMGFILLAKGAQRAFFCTELAATLVQTGLAWFLVRRFGPAGAGIAFFGLYLWHTSLIYVTVRRMTGFRWSPLNRGAGSVFLPLIGLCFAAQYFLSSYWTAAFGACSAVFSGLYALRLLTGLAAPERVPAVLQKWLARFRVTRRS